MDRENFLMEEQVAWITLQPKSSLMLNVYPL